MSVSYPPGWQTGVRGDVDEPLPGQDQRGVAVARALAMPTSIPGDKTLWHHDHGCYGCGATLLTRLEAQGLTVTWTAGPPPPPVDLSHLLTEEEKANLDRSLKEAAAVRRRGNASARNIPLP